MTTIELAILISCFVLCILSLIIGGAALILILALKNSTHRVEWKPFPIDDEGFMDGKELNKAMNKQQEELDFDQL